MLYYNVSNSNYTAMQITPFLPYDLVARIPGFNPVGSGSIPAMIKSDQSSKSASVTEHSKAPNSRE